MLFDTAAPVAVPAVVVTSGLYDTLNPPDPENPGVFTASASNAGVYGWAGWSPGPRMTGVLFRPAR